MAASGVLETLARADLDALLEEVRGRYRPGSLETLAARDPEWREALDRTEEEIGRLYDDLRAADAAFGRWRQAVGELRRLWARVDVASLDRVA
jgi:hypothetical protein